MLGTVRVLLVDDDDAYRALLQTALTDAENLEIEAFDCPEAALSWVTENDIDCVVSDFEMPAMSGGEFHDALRASGVDAPFVLVSGSESAAIPPEATADATAFVRKGAGSLIDVQTAVHDATQAARKEQTLAALHAAADSLLRATDRHTVANVAVETAEAVLNVPGTGVRFHDSDRNVLEAASVGGRSDDAVDERPPFPVDGTHHGRAFRTGETVTYDVPDDGDDDPYDAAPFGRTMYVPLGDHGVISFGKVGDSPFDPQDVRFAETLAGHAATALDRIERERALECERDRVEQVTSVVSHDLRNPLNVASGAVRLAKEQSSDDAVVDQLASAERATERMEALVDDLLTLTRRSDGETECEPVSLDDAARRAWNVVETTEASLALDDNLRTITADPEALAAMLENLFRNSVEHGSHSQAAPDGGREATAPVTVRVTATDGGFAVVDDGAGFQVDPEQAFERCFSTRRDGTGLGLSIVREAARAHGWRLDIGDRATGGARVEIVTDDREPSR